eukprot:4329605-Prymnesium_polylepis.1
MERVAGRLGMGRLAASARQRPPPVGSRERASSEGGGLRCVSDIVGLSERKRISEREVLRWWRHDGSAPPGAPSSMTSWAVRLPQ